MTECTRDHSSPDALPAFLCRVCHPELTPSPEQKAEADRREREKIAERIAADSQKRELQKAETKLASLTRKGEPDESTVNGKIAKSTRKKIAKLKGEA